MSDFWKFMYFLVAVIGAVLVVKYICSVLIAKYSNSRNEENDDSEWR
jgi:heme/copper-type cytochrome/quinol oxidase subunit 2